MMFEDSKSKMKRFLVTVPRFMEDSGVVCDSCDTMVRC
jgi:hypothetical protein